MSELRCLLMTDVVDSTQLVERLGDQHASALWEAHDRSARELLRKWNGREIDKSDGFLLLFASVEEAVGYAMAYHRALAELPVPLTARAGLHHGPVTLRHNAPGDVALGAKSVEVDGHAKSVTARVMALAAPAQTLMTAEARAQLGQSPLSLHPCGHWRAKGVQTPMELFVATEPGLPAQAPRDMDKAYRVVHRDGLWVPFTQTRHSLPAERDPFVGRQKPLDELQARLRDGARLVSVLGIGGIGKSRLTQRFGWLWLGDYPGGVWFCDLSQAHSLEGIAYAVAQGLDVPLGAGDPVVQLGNAIAGRGECLVICDNFEQVARLAEGSLGLWLDQAAKARFIVTTREVLGIAGETSLPLAPMDQAEAVRLFSLRAGAANEGMPARPEDDAATEPLVRLLDGLPLAIELAAARTRVMSPRELLQRMNDRFRLLASMGGRRDRQATLRATFDWSWGLLSATEKAAFAQLSVFEMGFRLPAAEAVLQIPEAGSSVWALDVLQMLVEKSLVRRVGAGRFDMLGSVREYAAEHLAAEGRYAGSGEAAARAARERHWRYYAGLERSEAIADRCVEAENLVAACRRATAGGDARSAVGCLENAWATLRLRGPFQVALDLARAVDRMPALAPEDRAVARLVAGSALGMLGSGVEARGCFESGLALAREAGSSRRLAELLCAMGERLTLDGEVDAARQALTEARGLAFELRDVALQCRVANELGGLAFAMARTNEARDHYETALTLARLLGDRHWEAGLLGNLAVLLHGAGLRDDARSTYERALTLAEETGDRRWRGNTHCNLGLLHHECGRAAQAREHFEKASVLARELGHRRLEAMVDCNLAIVLEGEGRFDLAVARCENALAVATALGDRRSQGQFNGYLAALYARRGQIERAREAIATGEALLLAVNDRLSLGLLLCQQVKVERAAGEALRAQHALSRASQFRRELGAGNCSELDRALGELNDL